MIEILKQIENIQNSYSNAHDELWEKENKDIYELVNGKFITFLNEKYGNQYLLLEGEYQYYYIKCREFFVVQDINIYPLESNSHMGIKIHCGYSINKNKVDLTILKDSIYFRLRNFDDIKIIDRNQYLQELRLIFEKIERESL